MARTGESGFPGSDGPQGSELSPAVQSEAAKFEPTAEQLELFNFDGADIIEPNPDAVWAPATEQLALDLDAEAEGPDFSGWDQIGAEQPVEATTGVALVPYTGPVLKGAEGAQFSENLRGVVDAENAENARRESLTPAVRAAEDRAKSQRAAEHFTQEALDHPDQVNTTLFTQPKAVQKRVLAALKQNERNNGSSVPAGSESIVLGSSASTPEAEVDRRAALTAEQQANEDEKVAYNTAVVFAKFADRDPAAFAQSGLYEDLPPMARERFDDMQAHEDLRGLPTETSMRAQRKENRAAKVESFKVTALFVSKEVTQRVAHTLDSLHERAENGDFRTPREVLSDVGAAAGNSMEAYISNRVAEALLGIDAISEKHTAAKKRVRSRWEKMANGGRKAGKETAKLYRRTKKFGGSVVRASIDARQGRKVAKAVETIHSSNDYVIKPRS